MTVESFPTFEQFYSAVNCGRAPFPWQARLAEQVAAAGWPAEIGVPTGLGKTTCLDIAVWALASQGALAPGDRTLPTRIWYVVNRRLLVDAAYEHGCELARLLANPECVTDPDDGAGWAGASGAHVTAIQAVGDRLRAIRGVGSMDDVPLLVSRLRGAADLGERPAHPAHPALIFATVPMFGSTWLFRSYAASTGMRPIDAAHAGIDSLVLLDEAHLSRPLRDLVDPLRECDLGDPATVVRSERSRPVLVSLTATGDAENPFALDQEDLLHPIVQRRLHARKAVKLIGKEIQPEDSSGPLAQALLDALTGSTSPVAAVVFTNTPATARRVFDELSKATGKRGSPIAGADLVLLTGRMRQREADIARRRILDPVEGAPAGRDRSTPRSKHLIVIATQTLEVGADLDFDVLVTESCGVRAFVQRLGRLNRLGECEDAKAVVVHAAKATTWPVYGEEPAELWSRLEAAADEGGLVDLAPARIGDVVGIPDDRPPRTPELLPAHLWEWAKTTVPPPGEAPVELFFEGFSSEGPRVTLCWRATRLPEGARLVPSIHSDETIDVPLNEAKGALENVLGENGELIRLSRDRVTVEQASVRDLRPSDIVVLNTSDGLYDEHGWAPESRREVLDVSLVHWPGLPLDVETLRHWFADSAPFGEVTLLVKQVRAGEDDLDLSEAAAQLVALSPELECRSELIDDWGALRPTLQPVIDFSGDLPILQRRLTPVVRRASQLLAADAFDDLSATVRSVRLDDHLASVAELAARLGQAVGLSPELVRAVEAAGRFHDLGKADPRFQLWLSAGSPTGELLAKSASPRWRWRAARELSGWPRGGRHEALSARLVEEWLADHRDPPWDADLVLHLVLSHHGFGRPLVAPVADTTATRCEANIGGVAVSVCGDLSETDWDQPSRFRRCCEKYGYWGLALLEAIVRQADHLASSQAAEVPLEVA